MTVKYALMLNRKTGEIGWFDKDTEIAIVDLDVLNKLQSNLGGKQELKIDHSKPLIEALDHYLNRADTLKAIEASEVFVVFKSDCCHE